MKLLLLLLAVALVLGCTSSTEKSAQQIAEENCVALCKQTTLSLNNGPCLSDEVAPDWVCDIAHSPRQDVDNIPENQCTAFGKTAHHFVEVDEICNVIRTV